MQTVKEFYCDLVEHLNVLRLGTNSRNVKLIRPDNCLISDILRKATEYKAK